MADGNGRSAVAGSGTGSAGPAAGSRSSETYAVPASSWKRPAAVPELAGQINAVATMVLNGGLDLERARVYSALVRSVAQLVTAEVARARAERRTPDLRIMEP